MTDTVDRAALAAALESARVRYAEFEKADLSLDITRGKPCAEQLDLSLPMLDLVTADDYAAPSGPDVRNYGGDSLGSAQLREMFAPLLDVPAEQLVVRDNASLSLMHFCLSTSFFDAPGGQESWMGQQVTFLAPVPGYDRHFMLSADLGVHVRPVGMTADGPDMDEVEALVAADPSIKGIWCVPKYSNPTGVTYSDEVVRRLAQMPTAAADFRIYWDNAYAVHHLGLEHDELASILDACAQAGHPDRAFVFASTSKVTFAGGGVSFFASSPANVEWYLRHDTKRSIGPDKINQLRHARFLGSTDGVLAHMEKHRELLAPKFEVVAKSLAAELGALGIASWTDPNGGYFVSVDVVPGTATRVVELAKNVGVALTPAGATFPGADPDDKNIRVAPTFPTMDELTPAMDVFTTCVVIAAGEKLLG